MAAIDHAVANNPALTWPHCPHHSALLQLALDSYMRTPEQVEALEQYLVEYARCAADEQASLFLGVDGAPPLIRKDCTCWMVVGTGHA
jgi:hypothetical protein